jgi:serine protease inhibitor
MYEAAGAENLRKTSKTAGELSKILMDQESFNVEEERKLLARMLKSSETGEHILDIGTRLFIDKAVEVMPEFMKLINDHYKSDVQNVKFSNTKEAVDIINTWSSNATHGKIAQLAEESRFCDKMPDERLIFCQFLFSRDHQKHRDAVGQRSLLQRNLGT